jgi:hypothetical protein
VVDYVESHFKKTSNFEGLSELEIVNMLSGNGGSQVDVVLYIISNSAGLGNLLLSHTDNQQESNPSTSNISDVFLI